MATKTFLTNDDKVELLERIDEVVAGDVELSLYAKVEDIPTSTSELTNDSGFITADDVPESANIKKNPNATDGDIIDTHLTIGKRTGEVGDHTLCVGGYQNDVGITLYEKPNEVSADGGIALGGFNNKITDNAFSSVIIGGGNNKATGSAHTIIGGSENTTAGNYAYGGVIIGGIHNNLQDYDGNEAGQVIVGGYNNSVSSELGLGTYSVIIGGKNNEINTPHHAVILGGEHNSGVTYGITTGRYNKTRDYDNSDNDNDAFVIGNGTAENARGNAFRVTFAGATYGKSAFNSTGADYAEYFEWQDGNINNEDRRGLFVTLDGDKVRLATADDDYILGVISAAPCLVGDSFSDDWQGKYLTDVFGEKLTQTVHYDAVYGEDGETIIQEAYDAEEWILNPDYDPEKEYIPREKRPEWAYVGSMGKLVVEDDGTCEVNGYCKVGENGIGTKSINGVGYRVMARIDDTHIRVWVR